MSESWTKIDRITREYARKNKTYRDWQKEKYPVHVENYETRVRVIVEDKKE